LLGQWISPTGSLVQQLRVNVLDADKIYVITALEIARWTPTTGWVSIRGTGTTALRSSDLHSLMVDQQSKSGTPASEVFGKGLQAAEQNEKSGRGR
jgi:hypothetical protein